MAGDVVRNPHPVQAAVHPPEDMRDDHRNRTRAGRYRARDGSEELRLPLYLFDGLRTAGKGVRDRPEVERGFQRRAGLRFPNLEETRQRGAAKIRDVSEPLPGGGLALTLSVVFQGARERLQHDPLSWCGSGVHVHACRRIIGDTSRGTGSQCGKQLPGEPGGHPPLVSSILVEADRRRGCHQVGGGRRRQRSHPAHTVQQRNNPLELRHRIAGAVGIAHSVQARRVAYGRCVRPRRFDTHPVEGGHQAPEEREAAEGDQDVPEIGALEVGKAALGEEEGRRAGGDPIGIVEDVLDKPGSVDGFAPLDVADLPRGILWQFDIRERVLPQVGPDGPQGAAGLVGRNLREQHRWFLKPSGPGSFGGKLDVRRGDAVEALEIRALLPIGQPEAERKPLARLVEVGDGVVQEAQDAVVLTEDRLEEIVRFVGRFPDHPLPQRRRPSAARHRDPAVFDDETAPIGGDSHGVAFIQLPEQLRVRGQEPDGFRRHGEQAVMEERSAPVGEQTKTEPLSRRLPVKDRRAPDLG